jgi:hypothetical protein
MPVRRRVRLRGTETTLDSRVRGNDEVSGWCGRFVVVLSRIRISTIYHAALRGTATATTLGPRVREDDVVSGWCGRYVVVLSRVRISTIYHAALRGTVTATTLVPAFAGTTWWRRALAASPGTVERPDPEVRRGAPELQLRRRAPSSDRIPRDGVTRGSFGCVYGHGGAPGSRGTTWCAGPLAASPDSLERPDLEGRRGAPGGAVTASRSGTPSDARSWLRARNHRPVLVASSDSRSSGARSPFSRTNVTIAW